MISGVRSWVNGAASCWPPRGSGFTPRSRSFTTHSPRRPRLTSGDSRGTRWASDSSTLSSSSTVSTSGAWTSLRQKSDPDCSDMWQAAVTSADTAANFLSPAEYNHWDYCHHMQRKHQSPTPYFIHSKNYFQNRQAWAQEELTSLSPKSKSNSNPESL